MCGITGIAYDDPARLPDRRTLQRMTDIVRHRGPDGEGFHVAPGVGLGFRRLSIIDLATGDQPIANEDGSIVVVCNGEIYNYVELRERLIAAGHRFATASDVEVIVHLYEDHGEDFVRHLRGMFALALWDAPRRRLVLARDRFGIKPLSYAITGDALVFGSEQKSILASGAVPAHPDLQAMRQLLTYGRTVTPRTLVSGIARLAPGHLLSWSGGRADLREYWNVRFPARDDYDERVTESEWASGLRDQLTESVRLHMRSDVPVGAWLSAGIDSSSVAALMSGMTPDPVKTFTMRFPEKDFDELHHQRGLDDFPQFRFDRHHITCDPGNFAMMPWGIWHSEGTTLGGTTVGQLRLAQASAAHVKVVLCGEGSDELLGGYSWYPTLPLLAPLFLLPPSVRRALASLPAIRRRWPGAASTIAGSPEMDFERFSRSISHLASQAAPARLFTKDVLDALQRQGPVPDSVPVPQDFERWHPFARMQYFDLKCRLGDGVVHSLDSASMAHSLEARVPFLDHELAEFCARIPPRIKMKRMREKYVLRRAMEPILPPEIAWRKKFPLQIPIEPWLRGEMPAFAVEELSETRLREAGYFDPAKVAAMFELHRAQAENLTQALSGVLAIQLWDRLFRRGTLAGPGAQGLLTL